MKKTILTLLLLSIPYISHAKTLTNEELLKIGAKRIECTIVDVGSFDFIATDSAGKEIIFNTNDSTIQFNPEEERLVVGDLVSVVYIEAISPSLSKDKTYALRVEWLQKAPRNFLDGVITCVLTPLKYRNGRTCYVDSIKQIIRFEGSDIGAPFAIEGDTITIKIKAVPASIGNGYIYKASPGPDSPTKVF